MTLEEIENIIKQNIPESEAYVLDPNNDGQHLMAIVVSPTFEGVPLIKQHKMVMQPLKEELKENIHALGLKTFVPEVWETEKVRYGF